MTSPAPSVSPVQGPRGHLHLDHITKSYSGTVALHPVTLTVDHGETFVLIGASGSGKSTLLTLLNRMAMPSAGTIFLSGQDVASLDPVHLRRRMGYVQQSGGLLPHWTVTENVQLVPALLGWDNDRKHQRSDELLDAVSLDPAVYGDRHPHQLSGGERQRVAIARALAADPEILLLDEPFSALDAITRREAQTLFQELHVARRRTVILVTHDLSEASRLGDRVAVLERGYVRQIGTPDQLSSHPEHPYVERLMELLA